MVDVSAQIAIKRPREEVAAFVADPTNDTIWISGVKDVRLLTEGPLRTGSRVHRTGGFMGKQFDYVNDVVDYEPLSHLEMKSVSGPFPMQVRYEFEESKGGTLVRIHVAGETGGFFRMAGPLLAGMVRRTITKDLKALKKQMEASSG